MDAPLRCLGQTAPVKERVRGDEPPDTIPSTGSPAAIFPRSGKQAVGFASHSFEWFALSSPVVAFASLDEELLKLMKRAGFKTINLSFVSTSPSIKEIMGRPRPTNEFDTILEKAEQVGLHVIAYAILGMPGQTIEEMVDTLIYLMGRKVLIGPSVYYPTPGTPLFERCQRDGILPFHLSRWRSSAFPIETNEFNRLDVLTLFRLARVINFIKSKMDEKVLEEGMTWRDLFQRLREKVEMSVRVATSIAGAALFVYGLIASFSPLPAGAPLVILGLLMIAAANPAARPFVRRLRRRWRWFDALVKVVAKGAPPTVRSVAEETSPDGEAKDR